MKATDKVSYFVYPGCIVCANGSAKFVNGDLPEIARIYHDRTIKWKMKRIPQNIREQVEQMAREPHCSVCASSDENFFSCPPKN